MPTSLIFPEGIRLANRDEIPGSDIERKDVVDHINEAEIHPGFVFNAASEQTFKYYAEINVDAPYIANVFFDLCSELIGDTSTLLIGNIDEELSQTKVMKTSKLLDVLRKYQYHLSHDCMIQYGIAEISSDIMNEVFVVPTKHFQVWFNALEQFKTIMNKHSICKNNQLEFVDEYPRVTTPIQKYNSCNNDNLVIDIKNEIDSL